MKILKPRNTLVTVAEIKDREKKTAAGIIVPSGSSQEYRVAEVIAVGPGCNSEAAAAEGLNDLKPGQTVLVKLSARSRTDRGGIGLAPIGLEYKDDSHRDLTLVEQTNIVSIIEDDGQEPALIPTEELEADTVGKVGGGNLIVDPNEA